MADSQACGHDAEVHKVTNDHSIRIALLEQSTEAIKDQLKAINGNMSKLVWLVGSALILAVLKVAGLGG